MNAGNRSAAPSPSWERARERALVNAILKNDTERAKTLLAEGVDPTIKTERDVTINDIDEMTRPLSALWIIGVKDDPELMSACLEQAGSPSELVTSSHDGAVNCLQLAASLGAKRCVELMLSSRWNIHPDSTADNEATALIHAASHAAANSSSSGNGADVVEALIEGGADVNRRLANGQGFMDKLFSEETRVTPERAESIVRAALAAGLRPGDKGRLGTTPLMSIKENRFVSSFRLIAEAGGVDVIDQKSDFGHTAMDLLQERMRGQVSDLIDELADIRNRLAAEDALSSVSPAATSQRNAGPTL